ncbi:MAG: AAA family ATPase [Leptospiraceae bacterium]|nr:AAA family ATPase [Leptospiraceae bacterium]
MYLHRFAEEKLRHLFSLFPVICIQGARQVGKSTLIENLFPKKIPTIVFEPTSDVFDARKDPDFFLQNHPSPLFLDEIQYAPELLPAIKKKVDREKKAGMYILSGSQNFSVLKNISESLAGRVIILDLYSMGQRELEGRAKRKSFLNDYLFSKDWQINLVPSNIGETLQQKIWDGSTFRNRWETLSD